MSVARYITTDLLIHTVHLKHARTKASELLELKKLHQSELTLNLYNILSADNLTLYYGSLVKNVIISKCIFGYGNVCVVIRYILNCAL